MGAVSSFSAGAVDHSAIYVIDVDGSHRRLLARGGRAPAWSPNSSLIAYRGGTHGGSCGGLRLVDADTGRDASPASAANPCHQFGPRQVEAPEWSPDGTEIAVGSTSGRLRHQRRRHRSSPHQLELALLRTARLATGSRQANRPVRRHAPRPAANAEEDPMTKRSLCRGCRTRDCRGVRRRRNAHGAPGGPETARSPGRRSRGLETRTRRRSTPRTPTGRTVGGSRMPARGSSTTCPIGRRTVRTSCSSGSSSRARTSRPSPTR